MALSLLLNGTLLLSINVTSGYLCSFDVNLFSKVGFINKNAKYGRSNHCDRHDIKRLQIQTKTTAGFLSGI